MLHGGAIDDEKRARVRAVIRHRLIGRELAELRREDEAFLKAKHARSVDSARSLLERQELELAARLRNLEQQKDTLKLLLEQISQEEDSEVVANSNINSQG